MTHIRVVPVEHITIECRRPFAEVRAELERLVPHFDVDAIQAMLAEDPANAKRSLETGPELAIFLSRDHGALLAIENRTSRAIQYEIGNPLTASKMTRHRLPAGLYAPLRIILYENDRGIACFDYDRPSTQFGQFENEEITMVARALDSALERTLLEAAGGVMGDRSCG
jgi:uncharacterized protein (DUF302 family)